MVAGGTITFPNLCSLGLFYLPSVLRLDSEPVFDFNDRGTPLIVSFVDQNIICSTIPCFSESWL